MRAWVSVDMACITQPPHTPDHIHSRSTTSHHTPLPAPAHPRAGAAVGGAGTRAEAVQQEAGGGGNTDAGARAAGAGGFERVAPGGAAGAERRGGEGDGASAQGGVLCWTERVCV